MVVSSTVRRHAIFVLFGLILAAPAMCGQTVVVPITNELSFYKNLDDAGMSRGRTLQLVSINSVHLLTDFSIEVTGDYNWGLDQYEKEDYYLELSLVKPVYKAISVNYQRIYGTFVAEPINQFGIRISLFR